ncbi:MAG: hypothetical protein MI747_23295 [Desulfobacterales bacterium]|nr:hypothetical protein [Desulfobacterales bacterium]
MPKAIHRSLHPVFILWIILSLAASVQARCTDHGPLPQKPPVRSLEVDGGMHDCCIQAPWDNPQARNHPGSCQGTFLGMFNVPAVPRPSNGCMAGLFYPPRAALPAPPIFLLNQTFLC